LLFSNPNNPTWICLTEEELEIIGKLSKKYDVIVIERSGLIFGMDFRKDYSIPADHPSSQQLRTIPMSMLCFCRVPKYQLCRSENRHDGNNLISFLKDPIPDLLRYYSTDKFGIQLSLVLYMVYRPE